MKRCIDGIAALVEWHLVMEFVYLAAFVWTLLAWLFVSISARGTALMCFYKGGGCCAKLDFTNKGFTVK
jgi:hypothetical protein